MSEIVIKLFLPIFSHVHLTFIAVLKKDFLCKDSIISKTNSCGKSLGIFIGCSCFQLRGGRYLYCNVFSFLGDMHPWHSKWQSRFQRTRWRNANMSYDSPGIWEWLEKTANQLPFQKVRFSCNVLERWGSKSVTHGSNKLLERSEALWDLFPPLTREVVWKFKKMRENDFEVWMETEYFFRKQSLSSLCEQRQSEK